MLRSDSFSDELAQAGFGPSPRKRRSGPVAASAGRNKMLMLRSQVAHELDHCLRGGGSAPGLFEITLREIGQPDGTAQGCKAVVRFLTGSAPPSFWLDTARRFGMLADLELRAVSAAIRLLPHVPSDQRLVLELSPQTVLEAGFSSLVGRHATRLALDLVVNGPRPPREVLFDALQPLVRSGLHLHTSLDALYATGTTALRRT